MENFALVSLVETMKPAMSEVIIRRVVQHQANGFIFQTRSARLPALKIILDSQHPSIVASDSKPPLEVPNADFLMVLRKHLTSAEVTSFHKPLSERIIEFGFKTVVPSRDLEIMFLIVELLPNAPNLILLDAERRVLSSFVPLSPQHGMAEYETYKFPEPGDKISLEKLLAGEPLDLSEFETKSDPKSWLISHIAGLGPAFAGEIAYRQKKNKSPVIDEIRSIVEQVRAPSHGGWLYTDLPLGHILDSNDVHRLGRAILSPLALESLDRTHSCRLFGTLPEAARFYLDELEARTLLEHAKMPVLHDLRTAAKRLADREKRLAKEEQKYREAESLSRTAQSLTSSGMKMEQHYDSILVTDYFSETPQQIRVALDSALSLRENIDRMFKRHQKAGRGRQIVVQQAATARNKRTRIEEQIRRLQAIKDWDTWLAIASRLTKERASPAEADPPRPETDTKRLRAVVLDGREVFVGRNGRENDEVTFSIAGPDDFWLHVADYSGSHVVVRNPSREKELDSELLTKAAQLAAYFSQARNSSKVEVHYTRRKNVVKPKRAKPGMVRLLEFHTIRVEPRNWLLE